MLNDNEKISIILIGKFLDILNAYASFISISKCTFKKLILTH